MVHDLFALAAENDARIQQQWEAACAGLDEERKGVLSRFKEHVAQRGRVSINMTSTKLESFLREKRHLNPYDVAEKISKETGEDKEGFLKRTQKDFYNRRVTFDRTFESGERFIYGALNTGGLGLSYYGAVCVIFGEDVFTKWSIAVLPGNSLLLYTKSEDEPCCVIEELTRRVGSHHTKDAIAAIKHADDLEPDEDRWPKQLCHKETFVETICLGSASTDEVSEIRVEKRIFDLLFNAYAGDAPENEQQEMKRIATALEQLGDLHLEPLDG